MLRRLLVGLILGLIVGGLVAAGLVAGLHIPLFALDAGGAALAYVTAAVAGVLTGLVAGKPIWASGAKIEAGLKAFFGALLATGLMFALRQWVHFQPDMSFLAPGAPLDQVKDAALGEVPALSLPLVAAVLGGFFELDNTSAGAEEKAADKPKKRVAEDKAANGKGKARVASEAKGEDDGQGQGDEREAPVASKRAKR
jgi:hypothetical protein